MNWQKVKYLFLDGLTFLGAHWYIVAGIVALLVLFFVFAGIDSCRTRNTEKKKAEINANIIEKQVEANVLVNQKVNISGDITNANKNSNAALDGFNNSVKRDSNSFTGNAADKFCARFPEDSSCQ